MNDFLNSDVGVILGIAAGLSLVIISIATAIYISHLI